VFITAAGRQRLRELGRVQEEVDRELRSMLSDDEVEVLGATLMRIHEHFDHHEEERRVSNRT
jgi:hypothetical protein